MAKSFWRPAGGIYLVCCLAGLAAGLYPDAIHPPSDTVRPAPLPTLSALAAAQAAYVLLGWPVVIARRIRRGQPATLPALASELVGLLLAAVPFYIVAAWFSNAQAADAVRVAVGLLAASPLAWLGGKLLARDAARPWTILALIALAVGLPLLHYILIDFAPALPADWAWDLSPVSLAWSAGRPRLQALLPAPAWAPLLWFVAGLTGLAILHLLARRPAAPAEPQTPPPA
jgi:hypothetical protein